MEHFIRIAFWTVALFGCLQAKPVVPSDWNFDSLRNEVNCLSDSTFYTPKNVKEKCFTTALDCAMRELDGTARIECDDPHGHINDMVETMITEIEKRNKTFPLTNSSECACEGLPETSFQDFLKETKSLFQQINGQERGKASGQ
ncbi:interleukin-15-like [Thunnus maccoyii]|uniref:interleukin-15-like n=1 Tax=Thunnus maccoyii TaxID=8240 RepID=UPI001C4D59D4|nr:interleukin-15-like [Thunnus maccoyii]